MSFLTSHTGQTFWKKHEIGRLVATPARQARALAQRVQTVFEFELDWPVEKMLVSVSCNADLGNVRIGSTMVRTHACAATEAPGVWSRRIVTLLFPPHWTE